MSRNNGVGTDLNTYFLHFEEKREWSRDKKGFTYVVVEITEILPDLFLAARSKGFVNFVYFSFRLIVLKPKPCVES